MRDRDRYRHLDRIFNFDFFYRFVFFCDRIISRFNFFFFRPV